MTKAKFLHVASFLACLLLTACGGSESSDSPSSDTNASGNYSVPANLVGEWVYIHSNQEFYLDDRTDLRVQEVGDGLIRIQEGDTDYLYALRSGNNNSQVVGAVSSIGSSSQNMRLSSTNDGRVSTFDYSGIGSIDVILSNVNDPDIEVTVTTEPDGSFEAEVPTGEYTIEVETENTRVDAPVDVNGTENDVGVLTLASPEQYNFKSELALDAIPYGNQEAVRGTITVHNYGSARGVGLSYLFECNDSLVITCEVDSESRSIDPGGSVSFPVELAFNYVNGDRQSVRIDSTIRDVDGLEWNDYMEFTVYKRSIDINLQASQSDVSGYIILPGHELRAVSANRSTVNLPYLPGQQYQVVLSNNSIDTETAYSIGFGTSVNDLTDFTNTGAFEPNDQESEATAITPDNAISAFLHISDIDYFTLTMPTSAEHLHDTEPEFYAITAIYEDGDVANGDGLFGRGELVEFDLAFRNRGYQNIYDVRASISSDDPYVQVYNRNESSFTIYQNRVTDSDGETENSSSYGQVNYWADYSAEISAEAPIGHQAVINIDLVDAYGNTWTDQFTITVEQTSAQFVYHGHSPFSDDDDSYYGTSGNDDNILNPGESARFNIASENTGNAASYGVVASLSSSDPYVSVSNINADAYDLGAGIIADSDGYTSTNSYFLRTDSTGDFLITAAADTPIGHEVTIQVTFADEYGNEWLDSFVVTVEAVNAHLAFYDISPLYDDHDLNGVAGNNNSTLTPGESASFNIAVTNTGSSGVRDLLLSVSSNDRYIQAINWHSAAERTITAMSGMTIKDNENYYLSNRNYLRRDQGDFMITVAEDAPAGYTAQIQLTMTDRSGSVWTDYFEVSVSEDTIDPVYYGRSPYYDQVSPNGESSGDGDGILEAGESARIEIALHNLGNTLFYVDSIDVSSSDSYITASIASNAGFNYDIPGGGVRDTDDEPPSDHSSFLARSSHGDIVIQASPDTPDGHTATIDVNINARNGMTFTTSFEVTVGEAETRGVEFAGRSAYFDQYSYEYEYGSGDADNILEPGEVASVEVAIRNTGNAAMIWSALSASTNDDYISVSTIDTTQNCWLEAGQNTDSDCYFPTSANYLDRSNSGDVIITVAEDTPDSHNATIDLVFTDNEGNEYTTSFDVTVGQP